MALFEKIIVESRIFYHRGWDFTDALLVSCHFSPPKVVLLSSRVALEVGKMRS